MILFALDWYTNRNLGGAHGLVDGGHAAADGVDRRGRPLAHRLAPTHRLPQQTRFLAQQRRLRRRRTLHVSVCSCRPRLIEEEVKRENKQRKIYIAEIIEEEFFSWSRAPPSSLLPVASAARRLARRSTCWPRTRFPSTPMWVVVPTGEALPVGGGLSPATTVEFRRLGIAGCHRPVWNAEAAWKA